MSRRERPRSWWVRMVLPTSWSLSLAMSSKKIKNCGEPWRWPACARDGDLPKRRGPAWQAKRRLKRKSAVSADSLRTRRKSALSCSGYQRNHLCQHKCCWTAGKDHYGLGIGWDGAYSNQSTSRGGVPGGCSTCKVPPLQSSSALVGVFD